MKKTAREEARSQKDTPARQNDAPKPTEAGAPARSNGALKPPEKGEPAKQKEAETPKPPDATVIQPSEEQQKMVATLKDIESALFALKFYPVAIKEEAKDEAAARLIGIYAKGNETVRQMLLYMIHEVLATSLELKTMHTHEYFKMKNPGVEPSQLRVNVYRAMFNYNTSLEGLTAMIRLLGRLKGSDDSVKVLTYHFSHLSSQESEANRILRNAILETLGESESRYALYALLDYARYTDNEHTFSRVVNALTQWEDKLETLDVPEKRKVELRVKLREIITSDFGGSHYG